MDVLILILGTLIAMTPIFEMIWKWNEPIAHSTKKTLFYFVLMFFAVWVLIGPAGAKLIQKHNEQVLAQCLPRTWDSGLSIYNLSRRD